MFSNEPSPNVLELHAPNSPLAETMRLWSQCIGLFPART